MNGAWQVALPATPSPLRRIEQHHNTLQQTKEIVLLPSTTASRKKAQTWSTDANQQHTNYSEECHQTIEVSQHQSPSPFTQDVTHSAKTRRSCQTQTRPKQNQRDHGFRQEHGQEHSAQRVRSGTRCTKSREQFLCTENCLQRRYTPLSRETPTCTEDISQWASRKLSTAQKKDRDAVLARRKMRSPR